MLTPRETGCAHKPANEARGIPAAQIPDQILVASLDDLR
jgi:hypothetical protein